MVSVAVLALERTDLHFIDAIGVKINGQYYLMQQLLPDIKEFSLLRLLHLPTRFGINSPVDLRKRLTSRYHCGF